MTYTCWDCGIATTNFYKCDICELRNGMANVSAQFVGSLPPLPIPYPPPPTFVPMARPKSTVLFRIGGHELVAVPDTVWVQCKQCDRKYSYGTVSRVGIPSGDVCTAVRKPKPATVCWGCDRDLCKELDAYYGTDPTEASLCSKCRRKAA